MRAANFLPLPEVEDILAGRAQEGQTLDFKEMINLDGNAKYDIVDDVVAFLNADGGNIIIGIAERKGQQPTLAPLTGDSDKLAMRLQDIIVSNIEAQPTDVRVDVHPVNAGFLVFIRIGRSKNPPHGNAQTGRYLRRRGRKNEPLLPGHLAALRESRERLMSLAKITASNTHQDDRFGTGHRFELRIVPIEHLDIDASPFEHMRSLFSPKGFPAAHGTFKGFKRDAGGYAVEAVDFDGNLISLFSIGDDWIVRSTIVHPIPFDEGEGRLRWGSFEADLVGHFDNIADFLNAENLWGMYAVDMVVTRLHDRPWGVKMFPRTDRVGIGRPITAAPFVANDLALKMVALVRQASILG